MLDNDPSLLLAIPDPDSPLDNGILLCVASLRHTVARILPANPRVVEFRFSTTKDGRVEQREWEPGPGLFLPVSPTAGGNGVSDVGDESGGPSFRGVGHRGLWNLVREAFLQIGELVVALFTTNRSISLVGSCLRRRAVAIRLVV